MNNLLKKSLKESVPVEIIYQKGKEFTKRIIVVKAINETYIKAYCYTRKQARIFKIDMVLAVYPVREKRKHHA